MRIRVLTDLGEYHLSADRLRAMWHDIEPTNPAERKPGTRYSLVWVNGRTLRQNSPKFDLRGISCRPKPTSSQTVILSYQGYVLTHA
jgi:hypothetical protein